MRPETHYCRYGIEFGLSLGPKCLTICLIYKAMDRAMTANIALRERRPLVISLIDRRGRIAINRVATTFGMSKSQLADTIGLGRESLYKATRANAAKTQTRVLEMLEIISRITDWAGGKEQAMAWYRAQPISAMGGRTAESMVKAGEAAALRDYLDHLTVGNFA
jgi:uncharacterized protein (DUF2384 family)